MVIALMYFVPVTATEQMLTLLRGQLIGKPMALKNVYLPDKLHQASKPYPGTILSVAYTVTDSSM